MSHLLKRRDMLRAAVFLALVVNAPVLRPGAMPAAVQAAPLLEPPKPKVRKKTTLADRKAAAKRAKTKGLVVGKALTTAQVPTPGSVPDYYGMSNWVNSPQPQGSVASAIQLVDGGSGYSDTPTVTITDLYGTGSGATATANVVSGVITGITLTNSGTNYTAPIVTITDATGTGATATATITGPFTSGIRKFVDTLPGLNAAGANNLGQYIPVAIPDTTTYPGSDYYEIELGEYTEQMHSDLRPTTLRGYRQTNTSDATVSKFSFLGPMITATKGKPVRIKFTNRLPTGSEGNLFLPVDTTLMGAGMGPNGGMYTQNRATLHLHGGNTPWISDGTIHQWITPAGENTSYPKGVSVRNVPDMPDPGPGSMTFFYSNDQSARLMFYHDHAYGITRLNVYAGEAAGYLLTDPAEQQLVSSGIIPADQIPLIVTDKTFVDPAVILKTDPTWNLPLDGTKSNLWLPHVYMPNQNPEDLSGVNPFGRWDYGPWFWPPWPVAQGPVPNPYYDPTNAPWEPSQIPGVPNLSTFMEAFMDTPLVNGTAYPVLKVEPKAYRFRILNADNDRFLNLQLHQAVSNGDVWNGTTLNNNGDAGEIHTVPSDKSRTWPAGWPTPDVRDGGIPDPSYLGPNMIQIGTEGGFLPAPVVWKNIPIGYDRDPRSITVGNIKEHNLFLGPAERADVIVDFSQFAGKTLILYNDAPAPVPAFDARFDYYTGHPDLTDMGGTPTTQPGYGPNTRTIMQIQVAASTPAPAYNLTALQNAFSSTSTTQGLFAASQDQILIPQVGYNSAYNKSFPSNNSAYVRIQDTSMTFTPMGATAPVTITFNPKAIAEEFEDTYGRMSAFLGAEVPFTNGMNQTTIFYSVKDPPTEVIKGSDLATPVGSLGDGTQIWKVTHNGVDTHPIHFHLFNVQLLNRVDWAGVVKPPEPNELGWKETVRMNPLEDAIVALRPKELSGNLPFELPNSIRLLDPTMPQGDITGFKNVDTAGNPVTVKNDYVNFGWEYVWHCHILGHEEMDMMRPVVFAAAPKNPPINLVATVPNASRLVRLTWTDNSINETGFIVQRATVAAGPWADIGTVPSTTQTGKGTNYTYDDSTVAVNMTYYYRVVAINKAGYVNADLAAVFPTATGYSVPSSVVVASPPAKPTNVVASQPGTKKTDPVVVTWTDNAPSLSNPPNYNAETGFTVRRATAATGPWTTLTTAVPPSVGTGGKVTYNDTTIKSATTYYYQVVATNKLGESAPAVSNAIKTR